MTKKRTTKKAKIPRPRIKSPTWSDLRELASVIIEEFGGPDHTAQQLSGKDFITLAILASLDCKDDGPIFGEEYVNVV